jgi:quercetin dioxygenase-like cupin family protein
MSDFSPSYPMRRVVTGLDGDGHSAAVIDGTVPQAGSISTLIWRTDTIPADNTAGDAAGPANQTVLHGNGSNFMLIEFPPNTEAAYHATDTIDYITVVRGELTLVLETGNVVLKQGDALIDRGILHGWRNDGPDVTQATVVTVPAHPVGSGATI